MINYLLFVLVSQYNFELDLSSSLAKFLFYVVFSVGLLTCTLLECKPTLLFY